MPPKEAKARIQINKLLEQSGWKLIDDSNGPANVVLVMEHDKLTYGAAYKALTIIKLKKLKIPIPHYDDKRKLLYN